MLYPSDLGSSNHNPSLGGSPPRVTHIAAATKNQASSCLFSVQPSRFQPRSLIVVNRCTTAAQTGLLTRRSFEGKV
jgi:hypothetical protein